MNERYLIALSYGVSWLVLGWGTYAFVKLKKWSRAERRRQR